MKRYPHTTPWSSAIGLAAGVATVATMGIAIVLPATIGARPGTDAAVLAARDSKPAEVTVVLERIDVVAARPSSGGKAAAEAKERG